jgi:alpha-beta hydrolase superfamily lysophospholipase
VSAAGTATVTAPWAATPPTTSRRGHFWVPGERVTGVDGAVRAKGPMFVAWEASAQDTGRPPVVLVHGGGGQGTDWLGTPDGRPGWAAAFVAAGHPALVVDRPGHGRSPAPTPTSSAPSARSSTTAPAADPATLHVPAMAGLPVALVTGGASPFADVADDVVASLAAAGADVERVHLPDHGVTGNGHALTYETNTDQALGVVLRWLDARSPAAAPTPPEES